MVIMLIMLVVMFMIVGVVMMALEEIVVSVNKNIKNKIKT